MKKLILLSFLAIAFLLSCREAESYEQTNSPYQGEWFGSYNGNNDDGEIIFTVSPKGHLEGKKISKRWNTSEELKGYVTQEGKYDANTKTKFIISGLIVNNKSQGQWSQNENRGTFNFEKR
ncbi:MAG: hypothetical protein Q4G16_04345 [Cruoricaptor ignavus]|nr:hypothetical protein [Cruoricaptor ignavus]